MAEGANISTTIQMLGAKEYQQSLKDINADLKLLKSGLQASQSAFQDMDGMDALSDRLRGLNAQYEQHRKKVELIAKQLQGAKAKYGENSDQVRTLQIALNSATVAMNKCGQEIETTQGQLDELTQAQAEAADGADDMADNLGDAADSAEDTADAADDGKSSVKDMAKALGEAALSAAQFAASTAAAAARALAEAARAAADALIECAGSAAGYADDMLTLSVQTGISAQTLQELDYASSFVDVSLDTMVSSMSKLTREMGRMDASGVSADDALTKLGLTIYDTNGNLKSSETMFWEVIYALGQIENPTERDALAMQLFGRSAQDLNPLIEASTQKMRDLKDEAHSLGVVLSDEQLAALGEYQDSLDRLDAVWEGLKKQVGAAAAGLFKPFVDDATGMIAEVNVLLSDGWQDSDADKLVQIFSDGFAAIIADAGELWDKLQPVLSALFGSLATFINEELPGIVAQALPIIENVLSGLGDLIMKLIDEIDWGKVGEIVSDALTGIINICAELISHLPEVVENINWGDIAEAIGNLCYEALKALLASVGVNIEDVEAAIEDFIVWCVEAYQDIEDAFAAVGDFFVGVWDTIKSAFDDVATFFSDTFSAAWEAVKGAFDSVSTWASGVWDDIKGAFNDVVTFFSDTFSAAWGAVKGAFTNVTTWASGVWTDIKGAFNDVVTFFSNTFNGALESIKGIFTGIGDWFSDIWDTICDGVVETLNWLIEKYNSIASRISDGIVLPVIPAHITDKEQRELWDQLSAGMEEHAKEVPPVEVPAEIDWSSITPADGWRAVEQIPGDYFLAFKDAMRKALQSGTEDASKGADVLASDYMSTFADGIYAGNTYVEDTLRAMFDELIGEMQGSAEDGQDVGTELMDQTAAGIDGAADEVSDAAQAAADAANDAAASLEGAFESTGESLAEGMAQGITAGAGEAIAAAESMAQDIMAKVRAALGINSPSKVFAYMGEMSAEGYAEGLKNNLESSLAGVEQLGSMAVSGVAGAGIGGRGIDYALLGAAVADAMEARGLGQSDIYMDGRKVGRSSERGVSRQSYLRTVSTYKGRAAAMKA